ncbi:VOC family protein [Austwickia chelonae]|uniref:VOC family protein n=1 Tax=Austwickia chelonae TaxID=100225 RepID=UPI000E257C2B|nr:VOC family protein [Austwickia chelonae]
MSTAQQPGRPIWLDLMTDDVEGAKKFYGELFSWSFTDQGEDFGHYQIISCGDHLVGGLMSSYMGLDGPTEEPTGPTTWTIYLRTVDLDAALSRTGASGAKVVFGPMTVADHGRQAMVVDPAGAHLGLWEPHRMEGFSLPLTPGTPVWFETLSTDLDKVIPFYRDALSWNISWMETPPGEDFRYVTNGAGEEACAGICDASAMLSPEVPSHWRVYFGCADADETVRRVAELGGEVQSPPQDSPHGRFAQVTDPQGAVFMINA